MSRNAMYGEFQVDLFERMGDWILAVGPPCANCVHFKPKLEYKPDGDTPIIEGIRACHANEMEFDFSCYEPLGQSRHFT